MRKIIIVFIALLLLHSCTKFGKNITVTGRVLNPITGEGLANIEVQLQKTTTGLPGGFESVKEVYTDADGYFELDHLGSPKSYHLLVQSMQNYYGVGWVIDDGYQENVRLSVTKGKKMNVEYHAVPYGKIKANVNYRVNPNKQIFQPGTYYGCVNLSSSPTEIPMGYYEYICTVTKPSTGTNTFTQEVFIPAGGIGEITINY